MPTNQEGVQAAIRASTGTTYDYNSDWSALFDLAGINDGPFNGRLLQWINGRLGVTYDSLPAAMQAFAVDQGFNNWSSMNTMTLGLGTARLIWSGINPTITGVTFYASPDVASLTWTGYAPSPAFNALASPSVASVTFTGPAPSVTGLLSANAIVWGSGNALTWGGNEITWGA